MSNYTDKMVAQLTSDATSMDLDYDYAVEFASQHNLSHRSVISKIKALGLNYTPKPKVQAMPRVRKAEIVSSIASAIGVPYDTIAGLAKSDAASLVQLRDAIS